MMKKIIIVFMLVVVVFGITGCSRDSIQTRNYSTNKDKNRRLGGVNDNKRS